MRSLAIIILFLFSLLLSIKLDSAIQDKAKYKKAWQIEQKAHRTDKDSLMKIIEVQQELIENGFKPHKLKNPTPKLTRDEGGDNNKIGEVFSISPIE